jgi:hypothetical protein
MKVIRSIIKTLFILTIIIGSFNVYGYNLKYKAEATDVTNNGYPTCEITTFVQPSAATLSDYNSHIGDANADGWIAGGGSDTARLGGRRDYASFMFVFRLSGNFTVYNPGFAQSSSSNNIYYDSYDGYIDSGFDSIYSLHGNAANIPNDQGTRTSQYMSMSITDTSRVILERWKVIKSNGVLIDVYGLTGKAIGELVQKFGANALSKTGIKFSSILRTRDERFADPNKRDYSAFFTENKDYMDTAWVYFECTVRRWNSGGRGFTDPNVWMPYGTSDYKPGASIANEFDNILVVPALEKESIKRQIYVNHVDEDGNVIPGFENSSLNLVDSQNKIVGTRSNAGPANGYQEYYTIYGDEGIAVRKSSKTQVGEYTYQFLHGKSGSGSTLSSAAGNMQISTSFWNVPYTFRTNTNKINDFVVVNLVYKKIPPIDMGLGPLQLVGRLEFINVKDAEYMNSTSGPDLDYIPSTKQLTPYAQSAYPYIVRALRYESRNQTQSATSTVTAYVLYKWDEWVYSHGDARQLVCTKIEHTHSAGCYKYDSKGNRILVCTIPEHTHTGIWGSCYAHKHDSTCDWYLRERSAILNRTFTYTVPYKHTWYQITNFKMYRISKLEVYDNEDNIGGTLFGGGTYTVNPSGDYEDRFDNSRGIISGQMVVNFPSKSYSLPTVDISKSKPANNWSIPSGTVVSSQQTSNSLASSEINQETYLSASTTTGLQITYTYGNDYVELDGMTNMLNQNSRSWSEYITKNTDSYVRNLDSTKTGSGSLNGSDISYTSNLMSYMKPTAKQTTYKDFAPNYQTVPVNRENGLRQLSGKIFYEVTQNPKYNVGSTSFDSTDSTYRLNHLVRVTSVDFGNYDKVYENGNVNKVNVLTPVNFGTFQLVTDEKVDHSTGAGDSTILQKNAEFVITPTTAGSTTAGYRVNDTREFIEGFYFVFDFNIMIDNDKDNYYETLVPALKPIYISGRNASIKAKTTDSFGSGSADQLTNSVKIVAVTKNATDALKNFYSNSTFSSTKYMDYDYNVVRNTNVQNESGLLRRADIKNDAYHAIYKRITTRNLGRIFDFAITDCTDIAFKDVFRKTDTENVNNHISVSYYSGFKQWDLYSQEYNRMVGRTNIGTVIRTILPLGPYTNTNTRYVNAPKIGYRIAFDLKTTGFMSANNANNTRRVEITPSYYYISKDGKTFDNNIKLYFKSANGNYVNFASSGYTIYYKPNDGYRYLRNSAYTDIYTSMSTKLEPLSVSDTIVLKNTAMSMNNTSFIQAWYGEFKLPNSTIAVSNVAGNVHNNINNPYSDGYIGVIFDVKCIDTGAGGFTLSYNTPDKSASSQTNTSQWDYEGFMNFDSPGSPATTISYKLENGTWQVNDATYQKIKGTVILFDMDNRAASDFE